MKRKILILILIGSIIIVSIFLLKTSLKVKTDKLETKENVVLNIVKEDFNFSSLSLEKIFQPNHLFINRLPKERTIIIVTTGDVIPARSVNYKMTNYNNFNHPFLQTFDFFTNNDVNLINLEAPLLENCPVTTDGMSFCGNQKFIDGLKFAHINVANLANNHILNWGESGAKKTAELLETNGITTSGLPDKRLAIVSRKGVKIGFIGWNLLDKFMEENIVSDVNSAKKSVDILIVSLHWGTEYTSMPEKWQIDLAHLLIDNGADIIAGNHPHWIQPVEVYKNKLIIYSHGNFIFDQEWSRETKTGLVGKHVFFDKKLIDSQFFPVLINDYSQPSFLKEEAEKVLAKLKDSSFSLIIH